MPKRAPLRTHENVAQSASGIGGLPHAMRGKFGVLQEGFGNRRFDALGLGFGLRDVDAQPGVEVQIGIGDHHRGEDRDHIATPVVQQQLKASQSDEANRDIVAEAVLAGEQVEKLPSHDGSAVFAAAFAEVAGFAKDVFENDGPRNTCHGYGQDQQPEDLLGDGSRGASHATGVAGIAYGANLQSAGMR